jgi:hypothetical protein
MGSSEEQHHCLNTGIPKGAPLTTDRAGLGMAGDLFWPLPDRGSVTRSDHGPRGRHKRFWPLLDRGSGMRFWTTGPPHDFANSGPQVRHTVWARLDLSTCVRFGHFLTAGPATIWPLLDRGCGIRFAHFWTGPALAAQRWPDRAPHMGFRSFGVQEVTSTATSGPRVRHTIGHFWTACPQVRPSLGHLPRVLFGPSWNPQCGIRTGHFWTSTAVYDLATSGRGGWFGHLWTHTAAYDLATSGTRNSAYAVATSGIPNGGWFGHFWNPSGPLLQEVAKSYSEMGVQRWPDRPPQGLDPRSDQSYATIPEVAKTCAALGIPKVATSYAAVGVQRWSNRPPH